MTSQPLALTMNHVSPVRIIPSYLIMIHCNSISLQSGPPSMFVSYFCTYISYRQCVPHAPPISISLSSMWWANKHSLKRTVHWASQPAAKLEHFNRLSFFPPNSSRPLCCRLTEMPFSQNTITYAILYSLLHVSATVTIIRQTFQYMEMTCSVLRYGITYCFLLSVRFRKKLLYTVIHKSLRDFRTRLRNNQDRHGRKEHINR